MIGRLLSLKKLVIFQGYIELCGGVRQIDGHAEGMVVAPLP